MNIVFWIIVIAILVCIWIVLSKIFWRVGDGVEIIKDSLKKDINKNEKTEENENEK